MRPPFGSLILLLFFLAGCAKITPVYTFDAYGPNSDAMHDGRLFVKFHVADDSSRSFLIETIESALRDYLEVHVPHWKIDFSYDQSSTGEKEVDFDNKLSIFLTPTRDGGSNFADLLATVRIINLKSNIDSNFDIRMESQSAGRGRDNYYLGRESYNFGIIIGQKLLNVIGANKELVVNASIAKKKIEEQDRKRLEERDRKLNPEVSNQKANELYEDLLKSNPSSKVEASIEAYRSTLTDGYKPTHLPSFSSSLIILDELKTGFFPLKQSDLPLNPILLNRKEIQDLLNKTENLILVQPISTNVKRDIFNQSKLQSEYISGHSERHNPAYDVARRDYQRALNEYNRVQADISGQSSVGSLWWTQALTNTALIATVSNALNNAKQRLAQTPQTTSIPIKQDYSYSVMQVKVSKDISYNLYIVDSANNKVSFKKYSKSDGTTFKLQYDKHAEDTGYAVYDAESDVETCEKLKPTFFVKDIVNDLVVTKSKEFKSKPYTKSLSFIKIPKSVKGKSPKKPKVVKGKLSGLMQSVVAIQDNGGRTIGTGFFVNNNLILTNRHVVGERKLISVSTKGGQKYVGKVLDAHYDLDIALVKVDGTGSPVKMHLGRPISEGEDVIAIGNPMGLEYSVTKGIISSIRKRKDKKKPLSREYTYIQTDVPINPGNSGGPLFMNGKVVGINTMKLVDENIEGIGFAIHYDEILQYLEDNNVHLASDKAKPIVKPVGLAKKNTVSQEDAAEKKLTRLKRMFDKGLITKDEYKRERSEVLEKF